MSRWWRAHDDSLDDPKVQRLPGEMFKAWYNLCCVSSKNDGQPFDIDEVVFRLRVSVSRARQIIEYLTKKKLIDVTDDRYLSHNWAARQFKSDVTDATAADRMRRYRKNRNPVTENAVTQTVTVTPPRAETEQSRKKDAEPNGSGEAPPVDQKQDLFRRAKEVLGPQSGGLVIKLLRANGGEDVRDAVSKSRAAIEMAAARTNGDAERAREYIGRVLKPKNQGQFNLMSGIEGVI